MTTSNKQNKIESRFKKTILATVVALVASLLISSSPSDDAIRSKVLKLVSDRGSCSGEQVVAPSGINYILTAAHCKVLAKDGSIMAIAEDGRKLPRRVIEEDLNSDLLILEGFPGIKGLNIASTSNRRDHVRTFTHGHGFDTYKTEGVIIQDMKVEIPIFGIAEEADKERCNEPKLAIVDAGMFGQYCAMSVVETATTALILPGSSGGPVVNDRGELMGVVSAGDGTIGLLITIKDIRKFISSY